jgi:hypothetical protein
MLKQFDTHFNANLFPTMPPEDLALCIIFFKISLVCLHINITLFVLKVGTFFCKSSPSRISFGNIVLLLYANVAVIY